MKKKQLALETLLKKEQSASSMSPGLEPKLIPQDRLTRMQASFEEDYSILVEDYEFFIQSRLPLQGVSTLQSKDLHTLEELSERLNPEQS